MPTPSKFTEERRRAVIDALRFGVSDQTAAMNAGIAKATLSKWLERAERARPGGVWHDWWLEVCRAKSSARLRLAESAFRQAHDDGALAWKMASRIEPGFRAEPAAAPPLGAAVVVRLELPGEAAPLEPVSEVVALPPGR